MPLPCKNPSYGYTKNKKVRLAFCGNKVVEAKSKKAIDLERKYNRKIQHCKRLIKYYYVTKGKRVYVN